MSPNASYWMKSLERQLSESDEVNKRYFKWIPIIKSLSEKQYHELHVHATVWIDAVQLEKANSPTEYVPREDIEIGLDSEVFGDIFTYPNPIIFKLWGNNRTKKDITVKFTIELQDYFYKNLPVQVYQCGYCNDYVPADKESEIPTNAIIDHIEQCPKAVKKDGAVNIQFRIVKDSDEIRNNVIKDLSHVCKCNLCEEYFENQGKDEMVRHLISAHESELYS